MNTELSPFFQRQLAWHKVDPAQLAAPVLGAPASRDTLVLDWNPERSDMAPLRVDRNHVAVFGLRELALGPGQRLRVTGPQAERTVVLIGSLSLAPGAAVELAMDAELVVDRWSSAAEAADDPAPTILLSGPAGVDGTDGMNGIVGANGAPEQPGGNGSAGGAGTSGQAGANTPNGVFSIGILSGEALFEIKAGAGGNGGSGGAGGNGGGAGPMPGGGWARGGNGGPGGPGGSGGAAGNGGHMTVYIQEIAPGGAYRTKTDPAPGGSGGQGGAGAIPGWGNPDGALGQTGVPGYDGTPGIPGVVEVKVG